MIGRNKNKSREKPVVRASLAVSPGEQHLIAGKRGLAAYMGPILQVVGAFFVAYGLVRFRAWSQDVETVVLAHSADPLTQFAFTNAAWPLWSGLVLSIVGPIWSTARTRSNEKLSAEVARLTGRCSELEESHGGLLDRHLEALQKLVDQELWRLYVDKLERSNHRRASVYRHTGQGFVLVSRCSIHPDYRKKGRTAYPENQGVIGLAWSQGRQELADLPDPLTDTDAYYERLAQQNLERQVAETITMRSRHLIGFALEDRGNRQRVGVLVVESTQPNDLEFGPIHVSLAGIREALNDYLAALKTLDLSVAHAREEGF